MVNARFLGWTDDVSGLDRFEVEVYLLTASTSGTLQQRHNPEITATVKPESNNFQYTAPQPGDYAIVVTVYDGANNNAKARKIFNYNDQPGFTVTNAPVYFTESNPESRSFITKLVSRLKLTVTWAGRFVPRQLEIRRVEPWLIDPYSIDDKYGTTFGLRSIAGMSSRTDMSLSCYYQIDTRKSDRGFAEPQPFYSDGDSIPDGVIVGNCSVDLETETATLDFDSPLRNGDTVTVWLNAIDFSGAAGPSTVKVEATLDQTAPNISSHQFVKNRDDKYDS